MPDVAGETVASRETGAVGRVAVAVADLGNGYILRPYGEEALRRAEVTCSCVKTFDSSRGECGEGAEWYKLSKMALVIALLSVQLSMVSHRCL